MTKEELEFAHLIEDWPKLWKAALPHIKHTLRNLVASGTLRGHDVDDDLMQEIALAVGEALKTWNPQLGAFSTYVGSQAHGHALMYVYTKAAGGIGSEWVAKKGREMTEASLEETTENEEGEEQSALSDSLVYSEPPEGYGDPIEEICGAVREFVVAEMLDDLEMEDRLLLEHLYFRQKTVREVAAEIGATRMSVQRRHKSILRKLGQNQKTSYEGSKGKRDWLGLQQHFPAHLKFWQPRISDELSDDDIKRGFARDVCQSKVGRVHADWVWKPIPEDLPLQIRTKVFGKAGKDSDTTKPSTSTYANLPSYTMVRMRNNPRSPDAPLYKQFVAPPPRIGHH